MRQVFAQNILETIAARHVNIYAGLAVLSRRLTFEGARLKLKPCCVSFKTLPESSFGYLPDGNWVYDGVILHTLGIYLHKDDGPALIYPNGKKCWYQYGQMIRTEWPPAEPLE